jgi:hypothetical protein
MCTVSYIPLKNGAILTSNRDEHINRGIALYPAFYQLNGKQCVFPRDNKAGGTWFMSNEEGATGILLNGAFEKHLSMPPYRKSRGLILTEIFQADSPGVRLIDYNLEGIENFTIILWENAELKEFRWDGNRLFKKDLDPGLPQIWSSATLFTQSMMLERQKWFTDWADSMKAITQRNIIDFHLNTQKNNKEYGLCISRENNIATSSITSIWVQDKNALLYHKDKIRDFESTLTYELSKKQMIVSKTITENEILQKS